MATIKQQKAFIKVVENGGNVSKAMREANYSPETAKTPSKLTRSKGWKELLAKIDEKPYLERLHEIAFNKKEASNSIKAIQEIFKLKDLYPANKLKVSQYEEELKRLN